MNTLDIITLVGVAVLIFGQLYSQRQISRQISKLRKRGLYPQDEKQAVMADVERLARSGERIIAIRLYRKIHPGVSLSHTVEVINQLEKPAASA